MGWDDAQMEVLGRVVGELGLSEVVVPPSFPVVAADFLRDKGVGVKPDREQFQMRRRVKDEHALAGIRAAQRATEAAMARVVEILGSSSPKGDGLVFEGEELTAERVRAEVIATLRAHGCEGEPPITSPGPQGAFVHELGTGPVRPGESLIVDIFPTHAESRFCADMTRTFCFGEAPELLRHMHATVREAVKRSTEAIRTGRERPAGVGGGVRRDRGGRLPHRAQRPGGRRSTRTSSTASATASGSRSTRPRAWASPATT